MAHTTDCSSVDLFPCLGSNKVFFPWSFPRQKLTNVRIMKENMRTGNLPANMKKNRVLQIIPCKDHFETPATSIIHHIPST